MKDSFEGQSDKDSIENDSQGQICDKRWMIDECS